MWVLGGSSVGASLGLPTGGAGVQGLGRWPPAPTVALPFLGPVRLLIMESPPGLSPPARLWSARYQDQRPCHHTDVSLPCCL